MPPWTCLPAPPSTPASIVGASAPRVEVNVGTEAAADAVAGTVNLGLEVAGDVDVGVDLGLDLGVDGNTMATTSTTAPDIADRSGQPATNR